MRVFLEPLARLLRGELQLLALLDLLVQTIQVAFERLLGLLDPTLIKPIQSIDPKNPSTSDQ